MLKLDETRILLGASMIIGICTITLRLHGPRSLKEKRAVIKGLLDRMRNKLNAGVAEVDALDVWILSVIALATVSLSAAVVYKVFRQAESLAENAPGVEIIDVSISLL